MKGSKCRSSSSKVKIEKWSGSSRFLNSLVSPACLQCKYTWDGGLCTHSHFREACGFLFSLHFSSGQPATFWSSWLCTLHDWTQLCQTSLRKLTFVYFERKKRKVNPNCFLLPFWLRERQVSRRGAAFNKQGYAATDWYLSLKKSRKDWC